MKRRKNVRIHRYWISDLDFFCSDPLSGEIWKDFNSFNDYELTSTYQVSNKGRVRNSSGLILRGSISEDGYHEIGLPAKNFPNGVNIRVHRLVLINFQGMPPVDMLCPTVQHINHDKLDNRIQNLCWMSAFDNNQEGHGKRCKIIDETGEHIFNSQKYASKYLNRYEDYVAECINRGYKLTRPDGYEPEVFTEVDSEWIKYVRPTPRNRNWCKLVIDGQCHEFESQQACSRFLGKPSDYISNVVSNSWPILTDKDYEFYLFDHQKADYVRYESTRVRIKPYAARCQIAKLENTFEFPSIAAAAKFIGRDSEYLRIAIKEGKDVKDSDGNVVKAIRLN